MKLVENTKIMSQWDRRAAGKNLAQLEMWAETLSLEIKMKPIGSENLVVKRRWVMEIIAGRRSDQQST
jgi:hypothetical protein